MTEYHKIENIFERDMTTNKLIFGKFRNPEVEYLKNLEWVATEKIDGMNIRIMWDGEKVTYGGKTDKASLPVKLIEKLDEYFKGKENIFAEKFADKKVCLYGEGYGNGIQTGGKYLPHVDFILFDVWIGCWLERGNMLGIADMFGLKTVPVIHEGTLEDMTAIIQNGLQSTYSDDKHIFEAEGIVCKPKIELLDKNGNRIVIKIKHRDFI